MSGCREAEQRQVSVQGCKGVFPHLQQETVVIWPRPYLEEEKWTERASPQGGFRSSAIVWL